MERKQRTPVLVAHKALKGKTAVLWGWGGGGGGGGGGLSKGRQFWWYTKALKGKTAVL